MQKTIFALIVCVSVVVAVPYEVIKDDEGQAYYLVPISSPLTRERRDVKWAAQGGPGGTQGTLGYQANVFEKNNHRIDATGFAQKNFNPNGPVIGGGSLGYTNTRTDSGVHVSNTHIPSFGNKVDVGAHANLWKQGNSRLDAEANWSKRYGGSIGTGKHDFNGGINFQHNFGPRH